MHNQSMLCSYKAVLNSSVHVPVCHAFIAQDTWTSYDNPVANEGRVESNTAESFNSLVKPLRDQPVTALVKGLLQAEAKMRNEALSLGQQWLQQRRLVVPRQDAHFAEQVQLSAQYHVQAM